MLGGYGTWSNVLVPQGIVISEASFTSFLKLTESIPNWISSQEVQTLSRLTGRIMSWETPHQTNPGRPTAQKTHTQKKEGIPTQAWFSQNYHDDYHGNKIDTCVSIVTSVCTIKGFIIFM